MTGTTATGGRRSAIDYTGPEAWTGTRRPLSEATGLAPALYTDAAVNAIEQELVFERAWVCVGLVSEATEPGTVLVRRLGRRSILITVDGHGARHGFINSCRHRGTELVESDCTVRGTLRCPYHRWSYALDGTLVATPRFDAATRPSFDRDLSGLAPVRIGASGCLLFACLDPETPPLATWLGDLAERLAGYDLESWTIAESMALDVRANWKLVTENFQECYHLPWVHPDLTAVSRVEDHYRYQGPGMYCGQTTTPISDADGSTWLGLPAKPGLDESDSISARHLAVFPNLVVSITPNHAFVMRLEPDGPDRTRENCTWLVPEPVGDQRDRVDGFSAVHRFWLEVNGEDIDIVERSQRGLRSATEAAGPLVPRFEESLHRFHRMLADHFTSERLSESSIPPGDGPGADTALGGHPNPYPPAIESSAPNRNEKR